MVNNLAIPERERAKWHEQELDVLASISGLLATHSGQHEMLTGVLQELEQRLGMLRCTVMLLSLDGNELVVEAARSIPSHDHSTLRYRRGEGVTGSVVQTGRMAIVPRISEEPRFADRVHRRQATGDQNASFICVPIVLGREVVGTLSVDMPPQPLEQLNERARLLKIVASLIAFDLRSRRVTQLEQANLEAENLRLRDELGESFRPENMIGNSRGMRDVYQRIHQVAGTDATVLIRGESGTGKELVASAIHFRSRRATHPYVKVNCAALNENLLESELFGHEKGAFTGAIEPRIGRIQEAEQGTLLLDEIGDFSPSIQVKLLRFLQEREFQRVGSNKTRSANVRVIAATNRDLEEGVEQETFRQDLYYRINVVPIFLPPLRDRRDDILLLADSFVAKYARIMAKPIHRISTPAINMMFAYHWPGNVRELENCIEHAVLVSNDGVIHGHHLPPTLQMPETSTSDSLGSLPTRVATLEKDMIVDAMKATQGNIAAAARQLGITARILRYKLKKQHIDFRRFMDGSQPPR